MDGGWTMVTERKLHHMEITIVFLLAFWVHTHGFSSTPIQKRIRCRTRRSPLAALDASNQDALTASTNVSFVLPRFYNSEVSDGIYPSPLHSIHVQSILTDQESKHALELATAYARKTGRWNQPDQDRHATYATCDFAVEDCERLTDYLANEINFHDRMWNVLSSLYSDIAPHEMSYLDLFCAQYEAASSRNEDNSDNGGQSMDHLEFHRDGSLLSFTILLNDPNEFDGGGTIFDGLRDVVPTEKTPHTCTSILQDRGVVRPQRAGDAVMHCGKVLHGADQVTRGRRIVLVGFVDVNLERQRPGVVSEACRDWGRMDVAIHRYKRQQERQQQQQRSLNEQNSWIRTDQKWIKSIYSSLPNVCPAFRSVVERADPNYQRFQKLKAEDVFLRRILMPFNNDTPISSFELSSFTGDLFDGEVTVL